MSFVPSRKTEGPVRRTNGPCFAAEKGPSILWRGINCPARLRRFRKGILEGDDYDKAKDHRYWRDR